jgi:hypothetical protein
MKTEDMPIRTSEDCCNSLSLSFIVSHPDRVLSFPIRPSKKLGDQYMLPVHRWVWSKMSARLGGRLNAGSIQQDLSFTPQSLGPIQKPATKKGCEQPPVLGGRNNHVAAPEHYCTPLSLVPAA